MPPPFFPEVAQDSGSVDERRVSDGNGLDVACEIAAWSASASMTMQHPLGRRARVHRFRERRTRISGAKLEETGNAVRPDFCPLRDDCRSAHNPCALGIQKARQVLTEAPILRHIRWFRTIRPWELGSGLAAGDYRSRLRLIAQSAT